MEEKQKREEDKIIEEKIRKEKNERLKERVVGSKALADNRQQLENKRKAQQESFKNDLFEKKENYQQELARRLQRVYNKPLMFETAYKSTEKIAKNRMLHDKVCDEINQNTENNNNESYNNQSYNQSNNYNESNLYDPDMKHSVSQKFTNLKEEDEEYEEKFDDI